jgi:hypothetical protein
MLIREIIHTICIEITDPDVWHCFSPFFKKPIEKKMNKISAKDNCKTPIIWYGFIRE